MKEPDAAALARFDDAVSLTQKLVSIPSMSGREENVVAALREIFAEIGCADVTVDRYGSIVARFRGGDGPRLLFDAHIDTVPVPDVSAWKHPPFGGAVEDGRLYGRGTSDMKGALGAMLSAARAFLKETGGRFRGEFSIAGVVHEECFEGVAAREISARVHPDIVVIGEASGLNLKVGQRGRAEIVAETFGKPAHSANPEKGVNAVYRMMRLVEAIRTLPCPEHPVLGKGILELTDIKSSPYPGASVVPDYCRVTFDRRLLTGETKQTVLAPLQALAGRLAREDPTFQAKISFARGSERCHTGETIGDERFFPAWLFGEEEPFVGTALGGLRKAGLSPDVMCYSFCTNGSHYAGEAGIRTIGFGPSQENLAHTIDEYAGLDQLRGAALGYCALMKAFLT